MPSSPGSKQPRPTHATQKRKASDNGHDDELRPAKGRTVRRSAEDIEAAREEREAPRAAKGRTVRRTAEDVEAAREEQEEPRPAKGRTVRRTAEDVEAVRAEQDEARPAKGRTIRRNAEDVESARAERDAPAQGRDKTMRARSLAARRSGAGMPAARAKSSMALPIAGVVVVALGIGAFVMFGQGGGGTGGNGQGSGTNVPVAKLPEGKSPDVSKRAELKAQLDEIEGEREMSPPNALKSVQELIGKAEAAGLAEIVAAAKELEGKISADLPAHFAREFDTQSASVRQLIEEKKLLDALQEFDGLKRMFTGNTQPMIATKLAELTTQLDQLRAAELVRVTAELEKKLAEGDWYEANFIIADLELYGEEGQKLADAYRARLDKYKQAFTRKNLAKNRAARRVEGQVTYEKALDELRKAREARAELFARRTAQGREVTKTKPIPTVRLRDKTLFVNATIEGVGEAEVTLAGKVKGQDVKGRAIDWNLLEPDSRVQLTTLTLTDDDAQGLVELGKYCLVHKRFDEAQKSFDKALSIDTNLSGTLPDVELFRAEPKYTSGVEKWEGKDRLRIQFQFDDEKEIGDFGKDTEGVKIEGGQLVVQMGYQLPLGTAYDFTPSLHYEIVTGAMPPGGYWCFQLRYKLAGEFKVVALFLGEDGKQYSMSQAELLSSPLPFSLVVQLLLINESQLKFNTLPKTGPIRVLADKDKLSVLIGEESVFSVSGDITAAKMTGVGFSRNRRTTFGLDSLTFEGKLNKEKYKRSIDERVANLQRNLRVKSKRASGREPDDLPRLSDEHKDMLPSDAAILYQDMITKLRTFESTQQSDDAAQLRKVFTSLKEKAPDSAAVYFYSGYFSQVLGEYAAALVEFDKALSFDADFPEVHAHRSAVLSNMDRNVEAAASIAKAIEGAPGSAFVHFLHGKQLFYARHNDAEGREGVEKLEIALQLTPEDGSIATLLDQFKAVLHGPPWPYGKPTPRTSAHYVLHSDLEEADAKQMLVELEQIHGEFERMFPTPAGHEARIGTCFAFATHATYLIYQEQSLGHSSLNTLGYYHPGLKDLHLFKLTEEGTGKDDLDTMDVARHEAFHQYIMPLVPSMPRWINEGMAEYFGAISFDKAGKAVNNIQKERLTNLKQWLDAGEVMKLRDLMKTTTGDFMSYGPGYGHAWLVAHLCLIHKPDTYKKILAEYFQRLEKGEPGELALSETFGKIDVDAMERDWKAMVAELLAAIPKGEIPKD